MAPPEPPRKEHKVISPAPPAELVAQVLKAIPDFHQRRADPIAYRYTVADFHAAYKAGVLTPITAMQKVVKAIAASEARTPPCSWFISWEDGSILEQAASSAQRWVEGKPLSVLDGVPFVVQDCLHAQPYPTTCGTTWFEDRCAFLFLGRASLTSIVRARAFSSFVSARRARCIARTAGHAGSTAPHSTTFAKRLPAPLHFCPCVHARHALVRLARG